MPLDKCATMHKAARPMLAGIASQQGNKAKVSLRESRYQVTTVAGNSYHLSAKELRSKSHEIEPHDPAERKPGTRYTFRWTGQRTLIQDYSAQYDLRGLSCKPTQHSSRTIIQAYA